jgi:tape measure domain-containing protein
MSAIGDLVANLTVKTAGWTAGFGGAKKTLSTFASSVGSLLAQAGRITALAGALAGVGSAGAGLTLGVELAAQAEQAEIAFGVLFKSTDTAKKVLGDLTRFAADTPFELPTLTDAARQLAAFGVSSGQIVPTLRRLGDLAAGTGQPIGDIAYLYGTARVQGRLFAQDINQFTGRGIPIIGALAQQFGVAESKVKKLVESGKVNFGHLEKAIASLTSSTGQFGGLTAAQSKSLAGRWSTLKDSLGLTLSAISKQFLEAFDVKGMLQEAAAWFERLQSNVGAIRPYLDQMAEWAKGPFGRVALVVAGVALAAVGLGAALAAAGVVLAPLVTLAGLLGSVFSPIGLVIIGIAGAVALLGGTGDTWGERMRSMWAMVASAAASAWTWIRASGEAAYAWLTAKVAEWRPVAIQAWHAVRAVAAAAWAGVVTAGTTAWGWITATWSTLSELLAPVWQWLSDTAATVLTAIGGFFGVSTTSWREALMDVGILAEFIFNNFGRIVAVGMVAAQLAFETFVSDVSHWFTGVLPTLLNWFGKNWNNIWFTALDLVSTVFINMGTNIRSAMKAIWNFIKSRGTGTLEIAWTPLTDGFVNAVSALPDIPKRQMGEVEAALQRELDGMKLSLGADFEQFAAERKKALTQPDGVVPLVAPAIEAASPPGPADTNSNADGIGGPDHKSGENKFGGAALRAQSKEAFQAILASMSGRDSQAKAAERTAKATEQTAASVTKLANSSTLQLVEGF